LGGIVVDASTLSPLPYTCLVVKDSKNAFMADANGKFYIKSLINRPCTIFASYIGYETGQTNIATTDSFVLIQLNSNAYSLQEVTVFARSTEHIDTLSFQKLKNEQIELLAGFSKDMFRSLQMMPGVSNDNELSAKYNVRGGTVDENATFINGIRVTEPFHMRYEPLISVGIFPIDVVDKINFSCGGFSAKYGDCLSSVLDVIYKHGGAKKQSAIVNLSLIDFGLLLDGPINSKCSYLFAVRKDYTKYVLKMAGSDPNNDISYYDIHAQLDYNISPLNSIRLNCIYSFDNFLYKPKTTSTYYQDQFYDNKNQLINANSTQYYTKEDDMNYSNSLFSIQSTNKFSNRISNECLISYYQTYDNYKSSNLYNTIRDFPINNNYYYQSISNDINNMYLTTNIYEIQDHIKYYLTAHNSFLVGIDYQKLYYNSDSITIHSGINRWNFNNYPDTLNQKILNADTLKGGPKTYKVGGYIENRWQINNTIQLNVGCRFDYFDMNRELDFNPRLSLGFNLPGDFNIRAAWGIFSQMPTFNQFKLLTPSSSNTRNQIAEHFILGFDKKFDKNIEIKIEPYFKYYLSVIPAERMPNTELIYDLSDSAKGATAYAKGIDFEFRKTYKKISIWISYGYLDTKERLKNGIEYLRYTDQRHTFSSNFSYYINKKWEFNFKYFYGSGYAYTPEIMTTSAPYKWLIGTKNSATLPPYERLDLRISRKTDLFKKPLLIYLDILNFLNRQNVYSYQYNYDARQNPYMITKTLLPLIPSIGLSYQF
jgi:outer membrane receptor for ferrienterochelin and colicin